MVKWSIVLIYCLFSFNVSANENCAKLMNALLKYEPQNKVALLNHFVFVDEDFCDRSPKEVNSNFKIDLLDAKGVVVTSKQVYLNTMSVLEPMEKDSDEFKKSKVLFTPQFRNVKFAVRKDQVTHFNIYKVPELSLIGSGEIK